MIIFTEPWSVLGYVRDPDDAGLLKTPLWISHHDWLFY